MSIAGIGIAIFLIFSMGISYFSGDKEKEVISSKLVEEKSNQEKLTRELESLRDKYNKDEAKLAELEEQLREAVIERDKLERALNIEERQREIERQSGGGTRISAVELEREREKARKQAEEEYNKEAAGLEKKISSLEKKITDLEKENNDITIENRKKTAENSELVEKNLQDSLALKKQIYDIDQAKTALERDYAALKAESEKLAQGAVAQKGSGVETEVAANDAMTQAERDKLIAELRDKNRAEIGALEVKIYNLEQVRQELARENARQAEFVASAEQRQRQAEAEFQAKLSELEKAKNEAEQAMADLRAQNERLSAAANARPVASAKSSDEDRKKLLAELKEKNRAEIAALEEKIKNLEKARAEIAENNQRQVELTAAAEKRERLANEELQARTAELDRARKDSAQAMAALDAERANSRELVARLRKMEVEKLAAEETLKSREAAYAQAKNALVEVGKETYKKQVANIESRLVSLEENKKGLEDKWAEAMVAIVKLDETAQKIEANIIKPGAGAQGVDVMQPGGAPAIQNDIETLKAAREKVRLAMENVKSTLQTSMESDTMRMKVEISQISESLDKISLKAKPVGLEKTASNDIAIAPVSMNDTIGREGLKEETITLKGLSASSPAMRGGERTEVASISQTLEGLNTTIDDVFKESAVTPVMVQVKEVPLSAVTIKHNEAPLEIEPMRPANSNGIELKETAPAEAKNIVVCTAPTEAAPTEVNDGARANYVVKKGDTLWSIAAKKDVYANPQMWPVIYKYNLSGIMNPDIISVNQALSIIKNPTNAEKKRSIRRAGRHNKERNDSDYIKRIRRELQDEFLQRG